MPRNINRIADFLRFVNARQGNLNFNLLIILTFLTENRIPKTENGINARARGHFELILMMAETEARPTDCSTFCKKNLGCARLTRGSLISDC